MNTVDRKEHWENIYRTKALENVGWYQPRPETSLYFLDQLNVPKSAGIIDIGGGDSLLVDHLLDLDYEDITVLDISAAAIDRAKARLGARADKVQWIVSDILDFQPARKYDLWHDRAAFHFLTSDEDASRYVEIAQNAVRPDGFIIMGTFSIDGPTKCSGLDIRQYSKETLTEMWDQYFDRIECLTVDHHTPSGSIQNYIFCSFRKSA